ncbi:MAG: hypothetical protein R6X19_11540 [Kiritimatiellia bacterium]
MKLNLLARELNVEILHAGDRFETTDVRCVIASDLMSDVLVIDRPSPLIVTSLASDQTLRTADIIGACGVLVVNGKNLPANMTLLAAEYKITLLRTHLPKFDACLKLGRALGY